MQNASITASASGTVELRAVASISMLDGVLTRSATGNLRYAAGTTLTVGALSTGGNVSLNASSITDSGNLGTTDITAHELRLVSTGTASGNGAGTSAKPLKLNVDQLAANIAGTGTGGLFLTEADALVIGTLEAINVSQVNADASLTATSDAAQSGLSSAGNLIVVTTAGSLSTLYAGGAISAAGNLLLQAGGLTSDLTLGAAVTNTAGATSLNAGRAIVQNASITALSTGQTIDLSAAGAIAMGQGAITASANGAISLDATTGEITLETLNAGMANVRVNAHAGSILARSDNGAINLFGADLRMNAGNGNGQAVNPLETCVDTLSATAGAGGVYVVESNGLRIDAITTSDGGAVQVSVSTGELTLGAGGIQTTGAGSVVLSARSAASTVTLDGPVSTDSGAITVAAAGQLRVNAELLSRHGAVDVTAGQDALFAPGTDIRTDANVHVRANQRLVMPDASVHAGGGQINLSAGRQLQPGIVDTTGLITVTTDGSGTLVFNRPNDRLGTDIHATTNRLDIQVDLASPGAVLSVAPLTASAGTAPVDIVIGGQDTGVLNLSLEEIDRLQAGFTQVVFGNAQAMQSVVMQGLNGAALPGAAPVVFKNPVVVDLSGAGSKLGVAGQVQGISLSVLGSGATTVLAAADIRMSGAVTMGGTLKVASASAITSTGGDLVLGAITGLQGAADPAEVLSLSAQGANVRVNGVVSALDGLRVSAALNVTFAQTVSLTGSLTIDATGVVRFEQALNLSAAGSLTIRGASSVVFANGVTVHVAGNLTLNAQSVVFGGGAGSVSGSGTSVLAITSATAGGPMNGNVVVGASLSAAPVAGALNLTAREITAIGAGFGQLVIGQLDQGSVTVAGTVRVDADVVLLSHGNLSVNANVETASASQVALTSSTGNITMAAGTRLDSHGGDVLIQADNAAAVSLGVIDARASSASNAPIGAVKVQAGNATLTSANHDGQINIFAATLDLFGWGPASAAAAGDVLEAAAGVVQVRAPRGLVTRESGADGRTTFNVMSGGQLYEQLVVIGPVTRVTQDPALLVQQNDASRLAAGLSLLSSARQATSENWTSSHSLANPGGNLGVASYLGAVSSASAISGSASIIELKDLSSVLHSGADLLNDQSYGIAEKLQRSYILGTPGAQPLVSGLGTFSQDSFEYWLDHLSV